jgi:hypothetical protein
MSKSDMAVFEQSLASAFNEAYASADFAIDSVEVVAQMEALQGWGCKHCKPDDDMLENAQTIIMANLKGWGCKHCKPDDDTTLKTPSASKLAFLQSAFEKSLCTKLSKSGAANFSNVHGCQVRTVSKAEPESAAL